MVSTGRIGCSAYYIESKPSVSAFEAINEAGTLYAGSGVDIPTFITYLIILFWLFSSFYRIMSICFSLFMVVIINRSLS